jgi:hypothetical protein
VSAILWAFLRGEIILGVLEMPGAPHQSGQLLQSQDLPRSWQKNQKRVKSKYFRFPTHSYYGDNHTKLAQKFENHPKPMKTMLNQWIAEKATFEAINLILLDPI